MKVIDLSHEIHPEIPVYPGTDAPSFEAANTIADDGFAEAKISMVTHTATHMDAPCHILEGGKSLDQFEARHFCGRALILDLCRLSSAEIGVDSLAPYEEKLRGVDFAVIKTGWSRYWGEDRYFEGFPFLSVEAADYLARLPLKGVAIDAISIDPVDSRSLPAHHVLLGNDIVIVENLTNLEAVESEYFQFACFPLKIRGADGSPIRAVAIENFEP